MKLRILKSAFSDAVFQVSKVISQKTTIPILMGIKVTADEKGILLTGSSSDISIQVRVAKQEGDTEQVFVEETGSVVLPGKVFGEIIRKLPGDDIEWIVADNFQTTIRSGQAEFQLNGLDPVEYPSLPQLSVDKVFRMEGDALKSLIRQTGFAVAMNETRGVLTGVLWELEEGTLTLTATDSHRLSRHQLTIGDSQELSFKNMIIPGKSVSELAKILTEDVDQIEIVVSENQILIKTKTLEFYSRLLGGLYPDTNRVIPKEGKTEVLMNTKELLHSVDRASLISRDGHDNVVKWTVQDGKVTINSAALGVGSVNEELEAHVKGPELQISFNARYMIEALRSVDEELVKIHFTGPMTPFTIKPLNKEESLHLIVPIRTR